MKLTSKQAHYLVLILQDTLSKNVVGYLSISHDNRSQLLNEIIEQQDNNPVELSDEIKKIDEKKSSDQ